MAHDGTKDERDAYVIDVVEPQRVFPRRSAPLRR